MKKRITITIDADTLKAARIRGIEEDTNLSALIEDLLTEWMRDYDKGNLCSYDLEKLRKNA